MVRKEKTVFTLLSEKPWWVSALMALAVYALLAFVLPIFTYQNPVASSFVHTLQKLAPIFLILFLIPGVVSAVKAWRKQCSK